jgi:hydrogenase-1 operon protein HyaE
MNYHAERAAAFEALIARLAAEGRFTRLAAPELAVYVAQTPSVALLYTGDPTLIPDSWDACVVLPELLSLFPDVAGAVLDPRESAYAARAYGVGKLPALVLLRNGEYLGVIEGMHDWQPYVAEMRRLLAAQPQPVPIAGVYSAAPAVARPA